ncbi:hypothetical protein PF005_g1913 [Phytophthora fragariae]|uniref:Uncharacterized protein n=1 Tax=Phytophthora fragariae TaxID=53985 RepID=A0A6A3MHL1_9STRA|nr:hypothetical protein PF003_g27238 [Phytophthora fragariae]KAE8948429.1 hypothetical protein PF009_g2009 [Phytophthora fragariae]KAE9027713.1 hypothetical protein PF011_g1908 [Phytophthora fragariae]KAE9132964.1 hypothetical protein PF010_g3001 [Phytophthora fragariae]KAE9136853.1 hypothetical protein PF007_g2030 [Phytophthora fragariae]
MTGQSNSLQACQSRKLEKIRKKADFVGKPAWIIHRNKLLRSSLLREFEDDNVVQAAIQHADQEVAQIKIKAYHTQESKVVQMGHLVYMISYSTTISEASRVANTPNPRGETKYTGNTMIAKVGTTSATEPPSRFVTLIQVTGAYARFAADAPIQVEFIAEGCPEHRTTFKLEGCIHKAMADYYLGASYGKSEVKELFFNKGSINNDSPLAMIFLSETIDYKGRIWMAAFVQCARRLMGDTVRISESYG